MSKVWNWQSRNPNGYEQDILRVITDVGGIANEQGIDPGIYNISHKSLRSGPPGQGCRDLQHAK